MLFLLNSRARTAESVRNSGEADLYTWRRYCQLESPTARRQV